MNLYTVVQLIYSLFRFYNILIIVYCLMSWFPIRQGGLIDDIRAVLASLVEPYLNLFRRFIPPFGGIDWSPIIAILALSVIQNLLVRLIAGIL